MKGPYERLKYELRRVWECPVCQRQTRTPGSVGYFLCKCQKKLPPTEQVWMKLISDGAQRIEEPSEEKQAPS